MQQLRQHLQRINQKSYKAYKDIANTYTFPEFQLAIDYVQGDPFAAPSKIRLIFSKEQLALKVAGLRRNEEKFMWKML